MLSIRKSLVAISDFDSGTKLLSSIIDFFGDWVTEIHLLNVIDSETVEHFATFRNKPLEEVLEATKEEYENILTKLVNTYANSHFYISYDVKEGIVSESIIETAKQEQVDFIVMGTKREKIAKRLLKNHVRFVIELSNIPVLLFPV